MKRKKYLWRHPDGRCYVRFNRGGKTTYHAITAVEGTAEFDRQYWDIRTGRRAEAKMSWGVLIAAFRITDTWEGFSPRYRADLEPVFHYIEENVGKKDVSRLIQADILDAMDRNAHRVRFANYLPTAFSMLSKFAIRKRWRKDNPAIDIEKLPMPKAKRKPHVPWTDAPVAKMRAEGKALPRLIFELGIGSVQRPGDLVGFTWGDYDGDALLLRQNKTDKPLVLPCTAALRAALDQAKRELGFVPMPSRNILIGPDGAAMKQRYMSAIMLAERKRLGLTKYDLHALRYRGVRELAREGCDDDEIAAYSGHTSKAMIIKYAGEERQMMRARQAREKRQ